MYVTVPQNYTRPTRLYIGLKLDYRLRLWAPKSASRAISAVAELLVLSPLAHQHLR